MLLDAGGQSCFGKPGYAQLWVVEARFASVLRQRNPDFVGRLSGQFVESKRREQAEDRVWYALGHLHHRVMFRRGMICRGIEPPSHPDKDALLDATREVHARDAAQLQFA